MILGNLFPFIHNYIAAYRQLCPLLFFIFTTMSSNPYAVQAALMSGDSVTEVMKQSKRAAVSLEYAQSQGFATVDEYLEALHEFLNGQ